jgi:hypothetical protein
MFKTRVDDARLLLQALARSSKLPSLLSQIVAAHVGQLDVLELPPNAFLRVRLRGVALEALEANPARCIGGEELLDNAAPVDCGSVPDNAQLARDVAQEVAEEAHDVGTPNRILVPLKVEPLVAGLMAALVAFAVGSISLAPDGAYH